MSFTCNQLRVLSISNIAMEYCHNTEYLTKIINLMQFVLYMTYLLYHAENMYYNIYNYINSKWDPDYSGSLVHFRTPELPR